MKAFFDIVRAQVFGGSLTQAQVNGLNTLLAATEGRPITHRAYILATAAVETAWTMQPVRETLADSDEQAVRRLDHAWRRGQLHWVSTPYWKPDENGQSWFGRGYVQLTHKENYQRAGRALGVDLVANPSAALNPELAALILVRGMDEGWFTGRGLSDYLPGDYVGARRIVNGQDRAREIAEYARSFEQALRAVMAEEPDEEPAEQPSEDGMKGTLALGVRIVLYMAAGALADAGFANWNAEDGILTVNIDDLAVLLAGMATAGVALVWRDWAKKSGGTT